MSLDLLSPSQHGRRSMISYALQCSMTLVIRFGLSSMFPLTGDARSSADLGTCRCAKSRESGWNVVASKGAEHLAPLSPRVTAKSNVVEVREYSCAMLR